jgi:PAS domain-containing protein
MARRMRALDWSKTPLGSVDQWPQALRTSVSTCLDCAFPIVLWWGPDLSILYNDEYIDFLGPKHPAALGRPGAEVWAEIWDVINPMLSQVVTTGEPTRSRDLLLHIDRGYPEEAYFSFSYSPIYRDDGTIGGVFCPVIETTDKVIGARRLRTRRARRRRPTASASTA